MQAVDNQILAYVWDRIQNLKYKNLLLAIDFETDVNNAVITYLVEIEPKAVDKAIVDEIINNTLTMDKYKNKIFI